MMMMMMMIQRHQNTKVLLQFGLLVSLCSLSKQASGDEGVHSWTYANQGEWGVDHDACGANNLRPSPINIITNQLVREPSYKLEFINYDTPIEFNLQNNGHSLNLSPKVRSQAPSVKPSWLPDDQVFELQGIHFHWGDNLGEGSEHRVDGVGRLAEMHMVHRLVGVSSADCQYVANSLLVIGVFIDAAQSGNTNYALDGIFQSVSNLDNGTEVDYTLDNTMVLLPDNPQRFYFYEGSLTTPPCYDIVNWIVMAQPIYATTDDVIELYNVEVESPDGSRHKLMSNYRQVQDLNDRQVIASFQDRTASSGSTVVKIAKTVASEPVKIVMNIMNKVGLTIGL